MGKRGSAPWPLVGRDNALAVCRAAIADRRGVMIAGPAGVGKTCLARVLADEYDPETGPAAAQSEGASVIRVAAVNSLSVPLSSFVPTRRTGSVRDGDGDGCTILVIDDVQSLDDDAAALLYSLVVQRAVAVVATLRTGEAVAPAITALWKDDHIDRVDLDDLTREQVDDVLDQVLGGPISAATRRRFWEITRGTPLTLRELVRASLDDGSLVAADGLWQLVREPRSIRLDEMVVTRLDALEPAARDVVELVAIGEPVGFGPLVADVGVASLAAAEQSGLIESVTDGVRSDVRLAHPLFGDVARRRLTGARTMQHSARLLCQLETTAMRREDDIVRSVVWQLRAGGTVVSADMVLAARRAMYDHQERLAIELATRALSSETLEAALILGSTLVELGDPERAETVMRQAAEASGRAVTDLDRSLVASERARALFWGLGEADAAEELLASTEAALQPGEWRDHVTAGRALMASSRGRVTEAWELARPFVEGDPAGRAYVTASIAGSCSLALVGRCEDAIALAQRAHQACVDLDGELAVTDPGIFIVTQAMAMTDAGHLVDAGALSDVAYDVTTAEGERTGQAWFSMMSARVSMMRGRLHSATERFVEAAATFATLHHDGPRRWSLAGAVISASMRGAVVEAERVWAELTSVPEHPAMLMGAEVQRAEAWIEVGRGHRDVAIALLRSVVADTRADGATVLCSNALHDLVRLGAGVEDADWDEIAACQGPLGPLRARFGRAVAARRAVDLSEVAEGFSAIGADMYAAESWSFAADFVAVSASDAGTGRLATRCRRLAGEAQRRTGEEWLVTLDRSSGDVLTPLTEREREVAEQAAAGSTNKEIAGVLGVSVRTVENHLQRAYDKLGVRGRTSLKSVLPT